MHIYGIHLLNPYKTVVSHLKALLSLLLRSRSLNAMITALGMHNYYFAFFVSFFQDPVEATGFGETATVSQGGTETFSCSVDENLRPNISWYRGSEVSGRHIFSAEKLEAIESGCYTCAASNSVGLSVIKLCLLRIYLSYNEICQNHLAIFLLPVFSYELCSLKITSKDLIKKSKAKTKTKSAFPL